MFVAKHLDLLLGAVLLIAGLTDIAQRKVYNWLTYPALFMALTIHLAAQAWPGLGFSLTGLVVGGLIFFPAFWVGGMGAGDIKLMAVVGAFMGWKFALNAAVDTAVIGGIAATVFLLVKGELLQTLHRSLQLFSSAGRQTLHQKTPGSSYALPYAVFIALGAAAAFFLPSFIGLA
jgi:prepilin peptidase CpaA